MRYRWTVLALSLSACASRNPDAPGSRYLYVWAGDRDEKDSDFLAVIDVRPASTTYGQVLGTVSRR